MGEHETTSAVPNPGSPAALAKGCTCPVLDNAQGAGVGGGHFWISNNCPVHAPGRAAQEART